MIVKPKQLVCLKPEQTNLFVGQENWRKIDTFAGTHITAPTPRVVKMTSKEVFSCASIGAFLVECLRENKVLSACLKITDVSSGVLARH